MRRSILAVCFVVAIMAVLITPVAAKTDELIDIWNWAKEIQQWTTIAGDQLTRILAALSTLQSDTNAIKNSVGEINMKVEQPEICNYYSKELNSLESSSPVLIDLVNFAATESEVEIRLWNLGNVLTVADQCKKSIAVDGTIECNLNSGTWSGSKIIQVRAPQQVIPIWLDYVDSNQNGHVESFDFFTPVCEGS
ncbi:MAG: hypothetical protein LUP99_05655 [Methanomicrobiales archaeon]|nr:hypothetical protein [Methanomicrobiales archaeon]